MTMDEIAKGIYEHYKGKRYEVVGQGQHTETGEFFVIYKALYKGDFAEGALWIRPLQMFQENVFIDGKSVARFRYLGKTT